MASNKRILDLLDTNHTIKDNKNSIDIDECGNETMYKDFFARDIRFDL